MCCFRVAFLGALGKTRDRMQIDPINLFAGRAASNAMERVREYYESLRARQLAGANYLKSVGEGLRAIEAERIKSQKMFEEFRRNRPNFD